jgi:hypothetical protein
MKAMNEMNAEELTRYEKHLTDHLVRLSMEVDALKRQNRWISVDERWPETEDVLGKVLVYSNCGRYWKAIDTPQQTNTN